MQDPSSKSEPCNRGTQKLEASNGHHGDQVKRGGRTRSPRAQPPCVGTRMREFLVAPGG